MGVATAGSATDVDLPTPIVDADFYDLGPTADAKVELGRLLFFDKVLSGNRTRAPPAITRRWLPATA